MIGLIRPLAFSLLLAACASGPARAQDALTAFAPLMGCWRGAFESNADIYDERCFAPMLDGRYVRDTHFVRPTAYGGETIYFVEPSSRALRFTYYASDGGMSSGNGRSEAGALVFTAHTYVGADGQTLRMRSRWALEAADRFVVTTEVGRDGAWAPWGQITYTRAQ